MESRREERLGNEGADIVEAARSLRHHILGGQTVPDHWVSEAVGARSVSQCGDDQPTRRDGRTSLSGVDLSKVEWCEAPVKLAPMHGTELARAAEAKGFASSPGDDQPTRRDGCTPLSTANAFLDSTTIGFDPSVTGREAFIAWADSQRLPDDGWWLLLVLAARHWNLCPLPVETEGTAGVVPAG